MATNTEIYEALVALTDKVDGVAVEVACMRGKWSMAKWMIGLLWPIVIAMIVAQVI